MILNLSDKDVFLEIIDSLNVTKENEKTIKNVLQNSTNCDRIIIVVGPEGGLTVSEEEKLEKNGFIPVTLGNLILRTETVPIYIMSLINYEVAL